MSAAHDYREKAAVWRSRAETSAGEARARCLELARSYVDLACAMESQPDPASAEALAGALALSAEDPSGPLDG